MDNRFQVVTFNNRHYIIECTTVQGNIAIQRVDCRKGGYTDLTEAQMEANIQNKYGDKPHSDWCLCDWCAYERFALTGERD